MAQNALERLTEASQNGQILSAATRLHTLAERRRLRLVEWQAAARCLSLLHAERAQEAQQLDLIARQPLRFIHGIIDRIKAEIDPAVKVSLILTDNLISIKIESESAKRTRTFAFTEDDYNHDADQIAEDLEQLFNASPSWSADATRT